jgi:predicted Rossmann fold nucleotide-binding protein DprA/Smf involved in DNA uptake
VTSALATVPLQLIHDGATMIRGAEDLLRELELRADAVQVAGRVDLSEEERGVLARLAGPTLADSLASELGRGVPEIVATLMRLELRGLVRSVGGRYESTLGGRAASG